MIVLDRKFLEPNLDEQEDQVEGGWSTATFAERGSLAGQRDDGLGRWE